MATRIERCKWCSSQFRAPIHLQTIYCPVCRRVNYLSPVANNTQYSGYYPQPAPPIPVNSYNNGYYQQTPPPLAYSNGYNPQQMHPPMYNNSPYYNQQVLRPPLAYGKKRAVLCGVSYLNTEHSLEGSVTDVESMKKLLIDKMGFLGSSVLVLTEAEPNWIPTAYNMRRAFSWLIQGCQAGDSLVFYYKGHGSRVTDDDDDEFDGYDEALCPTDYKTSGKILDDEINNIIVKPLPRGAQLHGIIDTCHSGTVLDLSFTCRMNNKGRFYWEDHQNLYGTYKGTYGGTVVCISACDDNQFSGNTTAFTGNATGALTYSFIKAVQSNPTLTYGSLLNSMCTEICEVQKRLGLNGPNTTSSTQVPQISCSEKFDIHTKKFMM